MYKIGIIGHSPEHFGADADVVYRTIMDIINLLGFQYGKKEVIFNVLGETGTGIWSANASIVNGYKHHLFLPYPIEKTYEHWYEEQKDALRDCYNNAYAITCCYDDDSSYKHLVDASSFIICFWVGKKQGRTYKAIKYALKTNKLVLNGLNDLKLVTNHDTKYKRK